MTLRIDKKVDVLVYITMFKIVHNGCAPTYREIAEACNIRTMSVVTDTLKILQDEGKIELLGTNGQSRMIAVNNTFWAHPFDYIGRRSEENNERILKYLEDRTRFYFELDPAEAAPVA